MSQWHAEWWSSMYRQTQLHTLPINHWYSFPLCTLKQLPHSFKSLFLIFSSSYSFVYISSLPLMFLHNCILDAYVDEERTLHYWLCSKQRIFLEIDSPDTSGLNLMTFLSVHLNIIKSVHFNSFTYSTASLIQQAIVKWNPRGKLGLHAYACLLAHFPSSSNHTKCLEEKTTLYNAA